MCRIHGYVGRPNLHGLAKAQNAQIMGGPDEQRLAFGPGWALGCNRLAIQDPAGGSQPFSNADGSVHLVFNGEIYNFRSVRDALARRGIFISDDSDGSVLLPLYVLEGDAFVSWLEGMFAIAVVDRRAGTQLKLFSDPLGVKSLYFTSHGGRFSFASEIRALLAMVGQDVPRDPAAVDRYFDMQCLPNGTTSYLGVSTLLPGEQVTVDGGAIHRGVAAPPVLTSYDGEEVADRSTDLLDLLRRECAQMSLQAAPIAIQLSGGLDSSLLATLLRENRDDVTGFHVTHSVSHASDEESFARHAAGHADIPLEVVRISPDELPELTSDLVKALGSPNATPHALSALALFRAIAGSGHRVCFVGDGADEQFGGYRRYTRVLADPTEGWMSLNLDGSALVPEAEYRSMYTPDYRRFVDDNTSSRTVGLKNLAELGRPTSSRLEQLLTYDRLHKLPGLNLRKIDHLAMANSIEARVPYCQPAVTRFARQTPDPLKVDGSRRKHVLWEAARGLVPLGVQGREKQPFTMPIDAFMVEGSKVWEFTVDTLTRPSLCAEGYLREAAVAGVLSQHAAGRDRSRLLWGLLVLELHLGLG